MRTSMKKVICLTSVLAVLATHGLPQGAPGTPPPTTPPATTAKPTTWPINVGVLREAEEIGVEVRVKDIAKFRGIRSNQLVGYGLVMGLSGTGDSKKAPFTANSVANMLKSMNLNIDPTKI